MTRPIPGAHLSINDSGMFDPKIPHLGIFSEFAPVGDGVEELAQLTMLQSAHHGLGITGRCIVQGKTKHCHQNDGTYTYTARANMTQLPNLLQAGAVVGGNFKDTAQSFACSVHAF